LDPKAKQQMDQVLAELRELKTAMKEHEQKQEEEDDAESD
jgi:proteasome assembly chaperone (PAC2) family protein